MNLRRLRDAMPVAMIEPVPYEKVRGLGFYRQFLNNCEWPQFMRSGRAAGLDALDTLARGLGATLHGRGGLMERMGSLDAVFIAVEDAVNHMHIGSVGIFEGPAPSYEAVYALVAAKLQLVPRYRQRVREAPASIGRPLWIDDVDFDLEYHLRRTALPAGDRFALEQLVGRVMSHPLDRRRPLWEMWVIEGLGDDRWAMLSKVHHCMVDGIAGSDLLAVIMDLEPDGIVARSRRLEPRSRAVAGGPRARHGRHDDRVDIRPRARRAARLATPVGCARRALVTSESARFACWPRDAAAARRSPARSVRAGAGRARTCRSTTSRRSATRSAAP